MNIKLHHSKLKKSTVLNICGSKSETNRLLILQAIYPEMVIENHSLSDDSVLMRRALESTSETIDIHHAGTAMRFLAAYFATRPNRKVMLTGSQRMRERPIKILVEALLSLGADIQYAHREGFPPLIIKGKKIVKKNVVLNANVSSQYISALMLIAPSLENGLTIQLEGAITSEPYIKMTMALLEQIGVKTVFHGQSISVGSGRNDRSLAVHTVESDWSSASYHYSLVALSETGTSIRLSSYKSNSLQGDSVLADIYLKMGVKTEYIGTDTIQITKIRAPLSPIYQNLSDTPDIAQTIAVTCLGLGMPCQLQGLHTLKIKETDRLLALQTEFGKLGGTVEISSDALQLKACKKINPNVSISTYQDHRMAMSFAPLALKVPLEILEADVVSKSYPDFWKDLAVLGVQQSLA